MRKIEQIILSLSILVYLTIFLSFMSLNRAVGVLIRFPGRIFFEHFFAGFYCPLFIIFLFYSIINLPSIFTKKYIWSKKISLSLLILSTILFFLWEILFQLFLSYNSGSWTQLFYSFLGFIFLWIYLKGIKYL